MVESPETVGYNQTFFLEYWNQVFKMQFLKYLNNIGKVVVPLTAYNWISENARNST